MNKNRDITKLISKFKLDCSTKTSNCEERKFHHGYECVDLDLPSGTLWTTCNVGAESETDKGLYFAWGETKGYKDGSTKKFSWRNYKWGDNANSLIKYNRIKDKYKLDIEDDAAHINMGGIWHMPDKNQCLELLKWTNRKFVVNYNGTNVKGMLLISKKNGKTLFFPNSGYCSETSIVKPENSSSFIWSSSIQENAYFDRVCMSICDTRTEINAFPPFYGHSIRGVIG